MSTQRQPAPTIIRRKEVEARTGLSRSTIYHHVKAGTFPAPVPLVGRTVGWSSVDIDRWVLGRLGVVWQEGTTEPDDDLVARPRGGEFDQEVKCVSRSRRPLAEEGRS